MHIPLSILYNFVKDKYEKEFDEIKVWVNQYNSDNKKEDTGYIQLRRENCFITIACTIPYCTHENDVCKVSIERQTLKPFITERYITRDEEQLWEILKQCNEFCKTLTDLSKEE